MSAEQCSQCGKLERLYPDGYENICAGCAVRQLDDLALRFEGDGITMRKLVNALLWPMEMALIAVIVAVIYVLTWRPKKEGEW